MTLRTPVSKQYKLEDAGNLIGDPALGFGASSDSRRVPIDSPLGHPLQRFARSSRSKQEYAQEQRFCSRRVGTISLALGLHVPATSLAQVIASAGESQNADVTVTARRRDENPQVRGTPLCNGAPAPESVGRLALKQIDASIHRLRTSAS